MDVDSHARATTGKVMADNASTIDALGRRFNETSPSVTTAFQNDIHAAADMLLKCVRLNLF